MFPTQFEALTRRGRIRGTPWARGVPESQWISLCS